MSLYIVGSILGDEQNSDDLRNLLSDVGKRTAITVSYEVEKEDFDFFARVLNCSSKNLCFCLTDGANSADSTENWILAMNAARTFISEQVADIAAVKFDDINSLTFTEAYFEAVRMTPLGGFLSEIILRPGAEHGCVWIADGGPEGELHMRREECEREILKTLVLTWDCLPNLAYVW